MKTQERREAKRDPSDFIILVKNDAKKITARVVNVSAVHLILDTSAQ